MNQILPKWLTIGLGGLLMVLIAILIVQKGNEVKNTIKNQKPANTISVSADGKVTATPDLATVNIGVMSQGTTATDVKNKNNEKINKIIDFIKAQGVSDADIKTSQLNFYPQQNWQNGQGTITGYQGDQTVTVKVHGIDRSQDVLEKVLNGVVDAGANQINGVNLTFENPDNLQQQARKQAIENAKQKAQDLAKQAGLSLGKVVSISEANVATPGPIPYAFDNMKAASGAASRSVAPNIEPGTQEINESMTVTFEVK